MNASFVDWVMSACSSMHIPTFMLMAGFAAGMSRETVVDLASYIRFAGRKFCRLMLPFLSVSLLTLVIKTTLLGGTAGRLTFWQGCMATVDSVLVPRSGIAGHLWFLHCLMLIFLIWPLLQRSIPSRRTSMLLVVLAAASLIPIRWPVDGEGWSWFGLADVVTYLPIFALGFWYRRDAADGWRPRVGHLAAAAAVFIAVLCILVTRPWPSLDGGMPKRVLTLVAFTSGALMVFWGCGLLDRHAERPAAVLARIGFYSYDIYLLHVIMVGHPLSLLVGRLRPGVPSVYFWFAAVVLATMLIPMVIGRMIRRFPRLAFIVLGLPGREAVGLPGKEGVGELGGRPEPDSVLSLPGGAFDWQSVLGRAVRSNWLSTGFAWRRRRVRQVDRRGST